MDNMNDCPIGQYCEAGRTTGVNCPAGTYNPIKNLKASSECFSIPEGYWSNTAGISAISALNNCGDGQTCPGGVTDPTHADYVCPAGHYCVGFTPIPCPAGTYGPNTGQNEVSDCV